MPARMAGAVDQSFFPAHSRAALSAGPGHSGLVWHVDLIWPLWGHARSGCTQMGDDHLLYRPCGFNLYCGYDGLHEPIHCLTPSKTNLTAAQDDSTITTMEINDLPKGYKSGYVAVAGKPNVGKSTLINRLLQQAVAAVSPKAQTTQRNQLGILTNDRAQIIFIDTPGIHQPHHKLGEMMNYEARSALTDADIVLVIVDLSQSPSDEDHQVAEHVRGLDSGAAVVLGFNKVDLVPLEDLPKQRQVYTDLLPEADSLELSALTGQGSGKLIDLLIQKLPPGPRYYSADTITDSYERDIAADMIRAAAMDLLHEEVPYSIAIRIDEYKERGDKGAYIAATVFVDRESQKGIVIGKGGSMLKEIGTGARKEIESMSGRKVYLDLRVKVLPGWRENKSALERLGYGKKRK